MHYFGSGFLEVLNHRTDLLKGDYAQPNFVALTDWFSNIFANNGSINFSKQIIYALIESKLLHGIKATEIFRFITTIYTHETLNKFGQALQDMKNTVLLDDPEEAYKNITALLPHCTKGCFEGFITHLQKEGLLTVPAIVKRFSQLCDLFEVDVSRQNWIVNALSLLYKTGTLSTQHTEMYVDIIMTQPDPLACARWLNQNGAHYQTKEAIVDQLVIEKVQLSSPLEISLRELTTKLPTSAIQDSRLVSSLVNYGQFATRNRIPVDAPRTDPQVAINSK